MNFDFAPQQYEFRDAFKTFLDKNYSLDRHRRLLAGDGVDPTLWPELADLGLFGMLVPEAHGGLGLSFVDLALVLEELGAALIPPPVGETIIATDALIRFGTPEQKARFLPRIATGKLRVSIGTSEADAGFALGDLSTTLSSVAGGTLKGRKILVPHAVSADLVLVTARLGADGATGLVLLDPRREGVTLTAHQTLDPTGRYHALDLDGVAVAAHEVIADPAAVPRLFDVGATLAALEMVGIAERMLAIAITYAGTRIQFGKPIGSFQAIKHRCADMAVRLETGRTATYYASWAVAEDTNERVRASSIAKSFCGDAARFVCNEAIQIHGGMGFTWELGLHFYLRRAKVLEYTWGDAALHRERVLADALAALPEA